MISKINAFSLNVAAGSQKSNTNNSVSFGTRGQWFIVKHKPWLLAPDCQSIVSALFHGTLYGSRIESTSSNVLKAKLNDGSIFELLYRNDIPAIDIKIQPIKDVDKNFTVYYDNSGDIKKGSVSEKGQLVTDPFKIYPIESDLRKYVSKIIYKYSPFL